MRNNLVSMGLIVWLAVACGFTGSEPGGTGGGGAMTGGTSSSSTGGSDGSATATGASGPAATGGSGVTAAGGVNDTEDTSEVTVGESLWATAGPSPCSTIPPTR